MPVREPLVAGQFYEADPQSCREHLAKLLAKLDLPDLPSPIRAALVPHAGWMFSGRLAAAAFAAFARQNTTVRTFVLFGAVHSAGLRRAAIYHTGHWQSPLGPARIDTEIADELIRSRSACLEASPAAHDREHSLEVQIPIIRYLFPEAMILPIMVPPLPCALEAGQALADTIRQLRRTQDTVCIGSTDLTHYGPGYGFMPAGIGPDALRWAKDDNDRRVLDPVLALKPAHIVEITTKHANACGGGAIAATLTAAVELGARRAVLLGHETSAEIMTREYGRTAQDSVGYASVVFG